MDIKVIRESVCFADDMFDNSTIISLDDNATTEILFNKIIEEEYLPHIHGNNVVWVLKTDSGEKLLTYMAYNNNVIYEKNISLKRLLSEPYKVEFKYYSSPIEWKAENLNDSAIYKKNLKKISLDKVSIKQRPLWKR